MLELTQTLRQQQYAHLQLENKALHHFLVLIFFSMKDALCSNLFSKFQTVMPLKVEQS